MSVYFRFIQVRSVFSILLIVLARESGNHSVPVDCQLETGGRHIT